jgi:uncharacterized protein
MFERSELEILKRRVEEPRKFIQILTGPRQVGKTTVLSQLTGKLEIPSLFESADAVAAANTLWLEQVWESARLKLKAKSAKSFLLIIDEIQKISKWSDMVKKLYDEDTFGNINLKVILSGSLRLLLERGLSESLTGRFEIIYMTHWRFDEMQEAFGWNASQYAWFGGYPGSAGLINDENRWKSYIRDSIIEPSISKDILMLTRIDKPALLKNLFELGCWYSGQILSYSKMVGQLQDAGNTTTLSHYLKILGTAGLLSGLEKYSHTYIRKRASSPKFQVYNNSLISAQMTKTYNEIITEPVEWGRIVESAVGAHLVNESVKRGYSIYYWRDRNDEVDFVLEKGRKVIAIEVKSSYSKNQKGMRAFQKKYNPLKTYLVDKNTFPWHEFISINPLELF